MRHQDWQDLIPFYVAQTLAADDIHQFEVHLAQCETCQREVDEWRVLASAVWRDTDEVAKSLPPLSPEVYNRLSYRDQTPQSRFSANPPRSKQAMPDNVERLPQTKPSRIPLTLVAGIALTVLFGGLLIFLTLRPNPNPAVEIVLDSTNPATASQDFGGGITNNAMTATPSPIPSNTPFDGILPTLDPNPTTTATHTAGPPLFFTNTPVASDTPVVIPTFTIMPSATREPLVLPPTASGSENPNVSAMIPSITPTIDIPAPIGGGPYITVTPGTFANGLPVCEAINPTPIPLEIFSATNRNSQISGVIQSGDVVPVLQVSSTGWYYVRLTTGIEGWLHPSFAYLRGNCVDVLPVVSPAPTRTMTPIGTADFNNELPDEATIVVINAAYADLYRAPNFDADVFGVAERDQQFTVLAYQGTGSNRWVQVRLDDGTQVWIWASIVVEYPADEAPPTSVPE